MITKTHTSAMPVSYKVCKTDFEIWDTVLSRRPGWKLETISGASDRSDAAAMFAASDETDTRAGMQWFNSLTEPERLRWLNLAGSCVAADAWAYYKQNQLHQSGAGMTGSNFTRNSG